MAGQGDGGWYKGPGGGGPPPQEQWGPPPQGYGPPGVQPWGSPNAYPPAPPWGSQGPMMPSGPPTIQERNPVSVILLTLVTCGIYGLIWKYQTTDELRQATGDTTINPGTDLLLTFVTCGIWAIYSDYRNAKKAHETLRRWGSYRSDHSTAVLLLALFGLALVSYYLLQEEYNAMSRMQRGVGA